MTRAHSKKPVAYRLVIVVGALVCLPSALLYALVCGLTVAAMRWQVAARLGWGEVFTVAGAYGWISLYALAVMRFRRPDRPAPLWATSGVCIGIVADFAWAVMLKRLALELALLLGPPMVFAVLLLFPHWWGGGSGLATAVHPDAGGPLDTRT